jgi:exosortase
VGQILLGHPNMYKKVLLSGALFLISILVNLGVFKDLLNHCLKHDFSTHILLIPFISIFLIYRERLSIFLNSSSYSPYGIGVLLFGFIISGPWMTLDLSIRVAGIVLMWIGIFLYVFGNYSFRKALFPLLFLVLMIPIPETILQPAIAILQKGSSEASAILFKLTGTPFYRNETFFSLPGINIEIAPQCSSIRSSLALLISSLLASHLLLESPWRKTLFVLAAVPMAMIKNAIRIVVLSLLAIHVNKGWLTDSVLHHEGGILFFILALLLLYPLLWQLRRSEQKSQHQS